MACLSLNVMEEVKVLKDDVIVQLNHQGEFLEDFFLGGGAEFGKWILVRRGY